MIRLIDAEKVYDNGTRALKGVSFTVDDGEFVFLVGPSGSGKSTIIKLMTGEVVPTAGRVMVNGFSMSRIAEKQIPYMRRTIGVIFQDFRLIGNKTVRDNLALAMRAVGASPRELKNRIPYVLELVGLADKENSYPDQLSGGEQQMLAMGRALMSRPRLLLLDEPSMGLAPLLVKEIFNIIKEINESGTTVLLVEQNANMALSIADKAYVLETGRIALAGTAQELASSEAVRKAYLGG